MFKSGLGYAEMPCMLDAVPRCAEHIAYEQLERYALKGGGYDIGTERIEAHLRVCRMCRESYDEEKLYIDVMRAALSAFNGRRKSCKDEVA
jgi:hypothetical protein